MGLHFILQHLDRPGTYVRILFVDFGSAFNTLIPDTFQNKLTQLSVPTSVCQSVTILQDLKWDTHIEPIVKKAQQRLYFLRQLRKFNLPQELLIQFFSAIIESVLCTSITVWFSSATKSDLRRLRMGSPDCWPNHWYNPPHSKNCTYPEWAKGLAKSLWTPHIQHTSSLNCYLLVDATELWAPEQPDRGTVSFPKQSISWTLDIKIGTHTPLL